MTPNFNALVFPSSAVLMLTVSPPWYEKIKLVAGGSPARRVKSVPSHRNRMASPPKISIDVVGTRR